jgi:hypothetical protein
VDLDLDQLIAKQPEKSAVQSLKNAASRSLSREEAKQLSQQLQNSTQGAKEESERARRSITREEGKQLSQRLQNMVQGTREEPPDRTKLGASGSGTKKRLF